LRQGDARTLAAQQRLQGAFDLLELDGEDLRREPIKPRKSTLKSLLRGKRAGIVLAQSSTVRLARSAARAWCRSAWCSPYRLGRAGCWVKVKNPAAPAVTREAEEEWN
jgi:bifunctional non-homologous end joining protein LigD